MVKKQRVALYIRVSTEEQRNEGFSLKAQEDILRDYSARNGFEVYDIYSDGGYSGKDFNRPEIQRLIRDIRSDKVDIVLAIAVDRISRNNREVLTFIDLELHPKGKKLLISTCDIDSSTDAGHMFISLLGTFAEYERKLTVGRVNKGMEKRATEGKWNGGIILGYDIVDKKLVINENESKIVKEIFELRAENKGYKTIANILNDRGVKTKKNKPFSINSVKLILENDKYIGNMTWGKHREWSVKRRKGKSSNPTETNGVHKGIISMELWDKVQSVNKAQREKATTYSNFKGEFILSGILKCPVCGFGTVMNKSKKRDGSGYHLYYMCQNYHSKGKTVCKPNLINKELIEEKVILIVKEIIRDH